MQAKIKEVLTPSQVQQLEKKMKDGGKMREVLATLDLSADQKAKIKDIFQAARAERKQSGENAQ